MRMKNATAMAKLVGITPKHNSLAALAVRQSGLDVKLSLS
jgi:hypothetical protein